MATRTLKYHEKKLLKKVDFFGWRKEENVRENQVIRKYMLQDPEDYKKYNKVVGQIKKMVHKLKDLDQADPFRIKMTEQFLEKLYDQGFISTTASLKKADDVNVSAICRRRLPVVLQRLRFCENIKQAVTYIEQGHIRVGPEVISDPAFLVTRTMEDYITWVDSSKIKRHVMKYNDKLDDYDLLCE
eukprot:TRINITY_DN11079_c0_g1_i1.p1 TRINITY_DN11079_c0_g1~~TRINITY_DN11079_c0_g1_i1.p1  ORF type:complete len:186 (-),score=27.02 TRINITY_DN11079_c0_g1_i1:183-740(-)